MFCCKRPQKQQQANQKTQQIADNNSNQSKIQSNKQESNSAQLIKNASKVVSSVPVVGQLSSQCLNVIALILISIDASVKMPDFLKQCRSKLLHIQALINGFDSKKMLSSGITQDFFEDLNNQLEEFRIFVEEKLQKNQIKTKMQNLMNTFTSSQDIQKLNNFKDKIDIVLQKFLLAKINDDISDTFPEFLKNIYKSKPGYDTWKQLFGNKEQKKKQSFIQRYSRHNEMDIGSVTKLANFIDKDENGTISFEEYMSFIDDYIYWFDEKGSRIRKEEELIKRIEEDNKNSNQIIISGNKISYPDGTVYQGEIFDGMRQGTGRITKGQYYSFEGSFVRDVKQGYGKEVKNSTTYEGEWKNNKKNGQGKNIYQDGSVYEGTFKNDLPEGKGKFITEEKNVYEGIFFDGFMIEGVILYSNGEKYQGQTKDTKLRHGRGRIYNKEGELTFEGNFMDNIPTQKFMYQQQQDQQTINKYHKEIVQMEIILENHENHDVQLLSKLNKVTILHIQFSNSDFPQENKNLTIQFLKNLPAEAKNKLTDLAIIIPNENMIKLDLQDFRDIFSSVKQFTNLDSLNLSLQFWGAGNSQVDGEIINELIQTYQSFKNLKYLKLDLHQWGYQNKSLKNDQVIDIIKGLDEFDSGQLKSFSLDLGRWGCDTYDSYNFLNDLTLGKMGDLIKNQKNIETLELNLRSWAFKNQNITNMGVRELFEGISKLKNLRNLDLGLRALAYNNKINQEALLYLANSLKKLENLENLKLNLELCDQFTDYEPLKNVINNLPKLQNHEIIDE